MSTNSQEKDPNFETQWGLARGRLYLKSEADYAKARKDREEGRAEKPVGSRTQIETVRDQNNRITEYVVTPGSTRVPYSVENRSEYPASSAPGHSKDTLGTPKFINFGF